MRERAYVSPRTRARKLHEGGPQVFRARTVINELHGIEPPILVYNLYYWVYSGHPALHPLVLQILPDEFVRSH